MHFDLLGQRQLNRKRKHSAKRSRVGWSMQYALSPKLHGKHIPENWIVRGAGSVTEKNQRRKLSGPSRQKQPARWRGPLFGVVGAVVGGLVVSVCQNGTIRLVPAETSYTDLAALLLTVVSVVVALFGGVLALAAIWGFNQLKKDAVSTAVEAGAQEVAEQIENGPLRDYIIEEINRLMEEEVSSDRMEQRIRNRVDQVAFGNSLDNDLDENEEGAEK